MEQDNNKGIGGRMRDALPSLLVCIGIMWLISLLGQCGGPTTTTRGNLTELNLDRAWRSYARVGSSTRKDISQS